MTSSELSRLKIRSDQTLSGLYRAAISDTLNKKYAASLRDRCFEVYCQQEDDEVMVTILLSNDTESFYYPVETRLNLTANDISAQDAAYLLCDYVDLYFENYFEENEELYIPIQWTEAQYEQAHFYIKAQIVNKALESSADALLNSSQTVSS